MALPFAVNADETDRIFEYLDKDDNGKITPGEYQHAKKKRDRIDVNDDARMSKKKYKPAHNTKNIMIPETHDGYHLVKTDQGNL